MPYDIYERIKVLRARMSTEGFAQTAEALREVVDYGSTGTEIHMGVRKVLSDFSAAGHGLDPGTRELIEEVLAHIERVLDGATGRS